MKRVLAASCFAFAGAVALAAQPPAGQEPRTGTAPAVGQEKTVTVTGCLRAGDQPNTFVLENVKPDMPKGEKATGTTGSPALTEGSTLRIMGAPAKLDLKAHVGHTVQLTGMIVPQGAKDQDPAGTAGAVPPSTPPRPDTPPYPPSAPPVPPTGSTPTTAPPAPTTPPQPTTPPEPTTGQSRGQRATDTTMQRFNVTAMKHVSEKCPM